MYRWNTVFFYYYYKVCIYVYLVKRYIKLNRVARVAELKPTRNIQNWLSNFKNGCQILKKNNIEIEIKHIHTSEVVWSRSLRSELKNSKTRF